MEAQEAFESLKVLMTESCIYTVPDFTKNPCSRD